MTNEKTINTLNSLKDYYNDKNEDSYVGFDNEDNEAIDKAIKAIKALEQTRWIPCCERLPEENIHVLCHFYMGGMAECYHAHGMWHIVGGLRISCDEVVAWMPLPEPYKEVEE